MSRSATQPKGENASSAVDGDLFWNRGVIEGNGAPDEAGAVFWQREGGVDTRGDSQSLEAVISRRVRKIGRKLQGRTGPGQARTTAKGRGGAGGIL